MNSAVSCIVPSLSRDLQSSLVPVSNHRRVIYLRLPTWDLVQADAPLSKGAFVPLSFKNPYNPEYFRIFFEKNLRRRPRRVCVRKEATTSPLFYYTSSCSLLLSPIASCTLEEGNSIFRKAWCNAQKGLNNGGICWRQKAETRR
jgi:hypothetical protein